MEHEVWNKSSLCVILSEKGAVVHEMTVTMALMKKPDGTSELHAATGK